MRQIWGVRGRDCYLAGAADAAPTLLESKGLLTLILVSLVLTAWMGGQEDRGTELEDDSKVSHHLEASTLPPDAPASLPPGSRVPPLGSSLSQEGEVGT